MTLPVSSYEELLARVRSLTSETIQLRQEISMSLCSPSNIEPTQLDCVGAGKQGGNYPSYPQKTSFTNDDDDTQVNSPIFNSLLSEQQSILSTGKKEEENASEVKEEDERSSPEGFSNSNFRYRNDCGPESLGLWHSGPSHLSLGQTFSGDNSIYQDGPLDFTTSLNMKDQSSSAFLSSSARTYSHQQLGAKVEMVYNLLSMLGTNNREDMSKTFLAMSSSPESCHAMRQSGCLPLLVQLIHSSELDGDVRNRAAEALHNIVHAQMDDKRRRREIRVLKLLEQVREYCGVLKSKSVDEKNTPEGDLEKHPVAAVGALMKFSFDAEHRQAICTLGGLQAVVELIQVDHEAHGSSGEDEACITLRRYAGMSLTNLTFGDGKNKALLCSFNKFLSALVDQLKSPSEDLRQVTASVLRNLSWRADSESKESLRGAGAVTALTIAAMEGKKESTLKSVLSALWNLSSHCSMNKVDICSVPGALAFLVKMLRYKSTSNTLAIVENAGGIIRNISSHIAVREDYRQILRDNNCFEVLLEQLRSSSLTIVSNACGTLWNLSARCTEDQKKLWEMGATSMLRNLVQSKHKMISMGSSAALKNLLTANPNGVLTTRLDSTARSLGLQNLPTLFARKQRALEQEIDNTLAETCENMESIASPNNVDPKTRSTANDPGKGFMYARSDSKESIRSSKSDSVCERVTLRFGQQENSEDKSKEAVLHESLNEKQTAQKLEDRKFMKRYKGSMIPTPAHRAKVNQEKTFNKDNENILVEEETKSSVTNLDPKNSANGINKVKRGIPVLKTRPTTKMSPVNDDADDHHEDHEDHHANYNSAHTILSSKTKKNMEKSTESSCTKNLGNITCDGVQNSDFSCYVESVGTQKNIVRTIQPEGNDTHYTSLMQKNENLILQEMCPGKSAIQLECARAFNRQCENTTQKLSVESEEFLTGDGQNASSRMVVKASNPEKVNVPTQPVTGKLFRNQDSKSGTSAGVDCIKNEASHQVLSDLEKFEKYQSAAAPITSLKHDELEKLERGNPVPEHFDQSIKTEASADSNDKSQNSFNGVPNFKIGSEVTNAKCLQIEANKICHEIRKCQDWDLGCSLNSQISVVSCSSFLDAADYSLFDLSHDLGEFDEFDGNEKDKNGKQVANTKPAISSSNDFVSLPSLGSLKLDQLDSLDLESSIISVASIVSEIAENNSNQVSESTCTMTYKTCPTATLGDGVKPLEQELDYDDDDSSLNSQENLPLDPESFKEASISEGRKKLTPREKRKVVQDRYRTYTIRDLKANMMSAMQRDSESKEKMSAGKAAGNALPLVQECTSGFGGNNHSQAIENIDKNKRPLNQYELPENPFPTLHDFKMYENERPIRTSMIDSRSLDDLVTIGPTERKELVDNAKLVALTLKSAAFMPDNESEISTLSDSEADYLRKTQEIDTTTYSKDRRSEFHKYFAAENLSQVEQVTVSKGPKISKSPEEREERNEEVKGIRGRRKKLYQSPYRKTIAGVTSTPNSPKITQKLPETKKYGLATTKSLPNVPKSISNSCLPAGLQREGTFTKKRSDTYGKGEVVALRNPSTVVSRNPKASTEAGERRTARPVSTYGMQRLNADSSQNKAEKRSDGVKSKIAKGGNMSPPDFNMQRLKNSASNQSLRTIANVGAGNGNGAGGPRSAFSVKSKNTAPEMRCGNFSVAAPCTEKGKAKPSKKEVESKIAKLWKMAEENKKKNRNIKDTRVWIKPEKNQKEWDEEFVLEQEEILEISATKAFPVTGELSSTMSRV